MHPNQSEKSPLKAIVAGSYDPVTRGHMYLIDYAAKNYQEVYAVIFVNCEKNYKFLLDERFRMLKAACAPYSNVRVDSDGGMQYEYAKRHGVSVAVRGYRNQSDLEYEKKIARFNNDALPGYTTQLLKCPKDLRKISSTLVREKLERGEDVSAFVPPQILKILDEFC